MKLLTKKEDVHALLEPAPAMAALRAAVTTGLLWMLAETPMSGEEISRALNLPGKRGYYWLQYLESFGILESTAQGYIPTPLARTAILDSTYTQEGWQHLVREAQDWDLCLHGFPQLTAEPGSLWARQGLVKPEYYVDQMRANPERAREFTRMLFEVHQDLACQVAALLDLTGTRTMMDVGGGSGVVSMALVQKYPDLVSTILDLENVCHAGREIAEEMGLSDRISYFPAEFESTAFPDGFDLVLQCDMSEYGEEFVKKIWKCLQPGGRYLLVDHFSLTENSAPLTRPEWTFLNSLDDPDYCFPTLDAFKKRLVNTGFVIPKEHLTLGKGWIVLEARKNA